MNPFPMIEKALRELIQEKYPAAVGKVGGAPSYVSGDDLYVWISLIPGGTTTEVDGDWAVDVDVFGPSYVSAMTHALALEAVLLERRHVTSIMRLDNTFVNSSPAERPWDDESVFRIGATYSFSARRSG